MDWREEKRVIADALAVLLPTLDHPHLAVPLAFRLAPRVGMPEARIRTVLGWLAKDGHPHATHDGGTVKSYGREVVRWRWHPQPQGQERLGVQHNPEIKPGAVYTGVATGYIDWATELGVETTDW